MLNTRIVSLLLAAASLWAAPVWSNTYPLPPADSRLIGALEDYIVQPGDHLELVGKHTRTGFLALLEANPGVDPYLPTPGTRLTLPTQMLLPDVPREGIVINLPELRLYYFPKGKQEVMVLPIGIGDIGRETPEMTTTVIAKNPNPTWVPGPMVRKSWLEQKGIDLPAVVPPAPTTPRQVRHASWLWQQGLPHPRHQQGFRGRSASQRGLYPAAPG